MTAETRTNRHASSLKRDTLLCQRVVIENITPAVDDGRFPAKCALGDMVAVEADAFADGHDMVQCVLLYSDDSTQQWQELPMHPVGNDRWQGTLVPKTIGLHRYSILGWVDAFGTWQRDLRKKVDAGQDVTVDLLIGSSLVQQVKCISPASDAKRLRDAAELLSSAAADVHERTSLALSAWLGTLMHRHSNRQWATQHEPDLLLRVDRPRAAFSAWYEMFPRSAADEDRHGTFADVQQRLPYVASMGFDVLYLPPIHPIGRINRKGVNNRPAAEPGDWGSPWAIGSREGGHKSIHPDMGTLESFRQLIAAAREYDMELALDVAFQCAPDHPYVTEHPEWFRRRPDDTIQFAENPPKKYEDIYPFDFECDAWQSLWLELKSIFEYWIEQGLHIFRVDNPHTKPFAFWEWLIGELKTEHPQVILLSEAFTRPKVMHRLARVGFTQSYTYFAWKNTKHELEEYFASLMQRPSREYFRPNAWPNTPDILNAYLQTGGRPAFMARLILAATLCANYGIYGPAFELGEHMPREPGSEEYLDSEKYQLRRWDLKRPDSLRPLVTRINAIRRNNPALQRDASLRFLATDNDAIICYSKQSSDGSNVIIVVVNLDPVHTQACWVQLPLQGLGLDQHRPFEVHDLLADQRFTWQGEWNFVQLNPHVLPAHVLQVCPHEGAA